MRAAWLRNVRAVIGLLLIGGTSSGCITYQDWVVTASEQTDYPELIEHVRSNTLLQSQLDKQTAKVFRQGEFVENWQQLGVDRHYLLENRPGGLNKNLFLTETEWDILRSSFASFQPISSLLGETYRQLQVDGPQELFERSAPLVSYSLSSLAPGVWLEIAVESESKGNAICAVRNASRLFARRSLQDLSLGEAGNVASVIAGVMRMSQNPRNCSILIPDGDSIWQMRRFTLEGKRLPVAEAKDKPIRIISLGEARRIIADDSI